MAWATSARGGKALFEAAHLFLICDQLKGWLMWLAAVLNPVGQSAYINVLWFSYAKWPKQRSKKALFWFCFCNTPKRCCAAVAIDRIDSKHTCQVRRCPQGTSQNLRRLHGRTTGAFGCCRWTAATWPSRTCPSTRPRGRAQGGLRLSPRPGPPPISPSRVPSTNNLFVANGCYTSTDCLL